MKSALLTLSPATKLPCRCGCGKIPPWGQWVRGHWLRKNQQRLFWEAFDAPPRPQVSIVVAASCSWQPQPERTLMLSVLSDAWHHKQECKKTFCLQCTRDREWAQQTAATFLYAFQSICDVLGLDGDRLRPRFITTA